MKKHLNKHLLIALLLVSSLATLGNAKFFLGIDGGYSMDSVDVKPDVKGSDTMKDLYKGDGYLVNINLGTQHYFDRNNYVGFRWFLSGGYGRTTLVNQKNKSISYPSSIIQGNLGIDLLLDVIKFGNHSLGLFGGVEGGGNVVISDATYEKPNKEKFPIFSTGNLYISPRVGASLFLAQHHRIEFVAKIPVYTIPSGFDYEYRTYHPIQFMLGYKFVF